MTPKDFKSQLLPYKSKLFRLAHTLLNSRTEAEDAVQDVYLKLWDMRRKLAAYDSVEALAVTMLKNLCIDRLRSYRSRNQNEGGLEKVTIPTGDRSDPSQRMDTRQQLQQVLQLIEALPEQQRMVLHLRDIEQYRYDEIEAMTGMSRNNIRVTLSRARKKVREQYLRRTKYEHRKN